VVVDREREREVAGSMTATKMAGKVERTARPVRRLPPFIFSAAAALALLILVAGGVRGEECKGYLDKCSEGVPRSCCDNLTCAKLLTGSARCYFPTFAPSQAPTRQPTISPSTPKFAPCQNQADTCALDDDCCPLLYCAVNGTQGQCVACTSLGNQCTASRECCWPSTCNEESGKCCQPLGLGVCQSDTDCCSGTCVDSVCTAEPNGSPSASTCQGLAKPCDKNKECCNSSFVKCGDSGTCCLNMKSGPCQIDSDCCKGICLEGICEPQAPLSPTASPNLQLISPRAEQLQSVGTPVTAVFVTAVLAVAAFFVVVRRRGRRREFQTAEEVRKNRRFASRKSITTFMKKLEKAKEDILIDPHRLDLGRVIGMGSHGIVYEGLYQGMDVAVKELVLEDDETDAKESRQRFLQEMLALHRLNHPNIIKLIGVGAVQAETTLSRTFFFVMELAKCSLRDVLQDDTMRVMISTLPKSLSLAKQICDGLAYMHSRDLMYVSLYPGLSSEYQLTHFVFTAIWTLSRRTSF